MQNLVLPRWKTVVRPLTLLGCLLTMVVLSPAADLPSDLRDIVFGNMKQSAKVVTLDGLRFDSLSCFSDLPYLMWPADGNQIPALNKDDREAVRVWLGRLARELGCEGFEPRYQETFRYHNNDVLAYELVRGGVVLHDARLMVHWKDGKFLGLQNHLDGRIVAIDDLAPASAGVERVYYPLRQGGGGIRAIAATIERARKADRTVTTVKDAKRTYEVEERPSAVIRPESAPTFKEYQVTQGTFPDQISYAEDGVIWFSQPNNNLITSFDPVAEKFTYYDTSAGGGRGADGLIVGTKNRVWSGMYYSGSLGMFDITTKQYSDFKAPYGTAAMAIPVETSDGHIWVTDHAYNRISEFDPGTRQWIQSIIMPTPSCWVVQGYEDRDRREVYFTEYNANKLGRIAVGGSTVTELTTPGGGPAFCVYSKGSVYYSRWNESGIGAYDVASNTFTEYDFPINNEPGGPLWLRPNGNIVCGTRGQGYIMVFSIQDRTFQHYAIPTNRPGLKDGLVVAPNNVIWFTESGVNKLGKLVTGFAKGDLNCDGNVDFGDISPFVLALSDPDEYRRQFPNCDINNGDCNNDGKVDFGDINPFVDLLAR